jgi:hypothetical protein
MSGQFAKFLVPPPVAAPRGAEWASAAADKLARFAHAVWRGLEAAAQARADRELRRLASQYAHQPEFAKTMRDAMHRSALQRDSHD